MPRAKLLHDAYSGLTNWQLLVTQRPLKISEVTSSITGVPEGLNFVAVREKEQSIILYYLWLITCQTKLWDFYYEDFILGQSSSIMLYWKPAYISVNKIWKRSANGHIQAKLKGQWGTQKQDETCTAIIFRSPLVFQNSEKSVLPSTFVCHIKSWGLKSSTASFWFLHDTHCFVRLQQDNFHDVLHCASAAITDSHVLCVSGEGVLVLLVSSGQQTYVWGKQHRNRPSSQAAALCCSGKDPTALQQHMLILKLHCSFILC